MARALEVNTHHVGAQYLRDAGVIITPAGHPIARNSW
jgi:hypothetical protein